MYSRNTQTWSVFDVKVKKELPGLIIAEVSGDNVKQKFKHQIGGIRWQRVPPSERKGRVHTSSITVAVLEKETTIDVSINEKDIYVRRYKAGGKGGQHQNKTDSAVEITHVLTGLKAKSDSERCQHANKDIALESLKEKVQEHYNRSKSQNRTETRQNQIGSGMRGDKIQTVQEQNGQVVNHKTGKTTSFKNYIKGKLDKLI